ncbi:MAG: TIGR04086 family membrane protein [Clostridia bacterium]|nr:TIGR04086 family membrane protein [Clostridia bacterium]MBR2323897.1 TIGR04086 family membrane protein [Clostridia bacterium]
MNSTNVKQIAKGVLLSLIFFTISLFIISLIAYFTDVDGGILSTIFSVLKQASVIAGTLLAVCGDKGYLKGLIIGAIYSVLAFALYSIISGTAEFNQVLGIEIVFSTLFGLFSGIIAVNVKK